ncbi:tetratricopeptide repeat protein [Massilia arenosa]|uniref:Tetratricopeptide repeat protein n=1 Tax=Zemynaea arenosa TaxID=2561931 RepID=A0A4Y9SUV9_9BURK|nr:tetratricopeptide repeat protein [Massilia arenosa]TFW30245.1 tetratricopeptide repeat protein [Massilia arenosa]
MIWMHRLRAGFAALLLACALPALANETAPPEKEQELYLKAVQLMGEGKLEEARAALEHLIELEPQHAGAWLDLAISQCSLGHAVEAERLFREIEVRFAPSVGILEVINTNRQTGCRGWQPRSFWGAVLTRGFDDNVNQGASNPVFVIGSGSNQVEQTLSPDYLPQSDGYAQLALDFTRELSQKGTLAFAQVRARRYDSLRAQDTAAVLAGVLRPFTIGNWGARASGSVSAVTLGGKMYQSQALVQGQLAPPFKLPGQFDFALSGALGHVQYVSRHAFDADNGEAGVMLQRRGEGQQLQLGLGRMADRGATARLGGNRHGWYGSALYQWRINEHFSSELGWSRQDWHGQTVYSEGLIDVVRHQSTRQWRLGGSWQINKHNSLQFEWRDIHNRENISLFQYNGHAVQLNWRWDGP